MSNKKPAMFAEDLNHENSSNIEPLIKFKSHIASEIEMKSQKWLWEGYIPLETCTLFAGTGGIGKSTLLAYLMAIVTQGGRFKFNSLEYDIPKGNVVLLSAEDSFESNIVPRLTAVGSDLMAIHMIESTIDANCTERERFVELDKDLYILDAKIKEIGNVKLVVLDPVTAYIGDIRDNRAVEVRNFILRLNAIAKKNDLAIILNTHTRKKGINGEGGSAADEIMGSSAWYNTIRQAFSITKHHEDENLILFINSKSNCGAKPEALSYRIEPYDIEHGGQLIKVSRVTWQIGKVNMTADEAMHKGTYEVKLEIEKAKDFILDQLKMGSKERKTLERAAIDEGINIKTLQRARDRLIKEGTNIVSEPSQTNRSKNIWYIGN